MNKILYATLALSVPLFTCAQVNSGTDTTAKNSKAPMCAAQAASSNKLLPVIQNSGQPQSAVQLAESGQQPQVAATVRSDKPASAVDLINQSHQNPKPATEQSNQGSSAPH